MRTRTNAHMRLEGGDVTLRTIDLFAGIGGIRLGFEQAIGSRTVFVSEWDECANKTYRANFGDSCEIAGDITKVDTADIPDFDICLAGFPCQAFSIAGKKRGFDDSYKGMSRGTLFAEVVRICEKKQPSVIFCENVKGLAQHDRGRTLKVIVGAFEEIGYKVWYDVLNSCDYGVPQNRERIYIVCFRSDIAPNTFLFPVGGNGGEKTIADILDPSPIPSRYYLSEAYLSSLEKHRARHEAKGHGFGYVIRDLDGVAGSLVCGGMGRERNLIVDRREHSMVPTTNIKGPINNRDIRKMTPREWARLQGFPDSFMLPVADINAYRQLGNTVTVPVIRAIAKQIGECLSTVM